MIAIGAAALCCRPWLAPSPDMVNAVSGHSRLRVGVGDAFGDGLALLDFLGPGQQAGSPG
ncbi:MAG: hypothetical protein WBH47_00495 [Streptosporangiaceae bacterium]